MSLVIFPILHQTMFSVAVLLVRHWLIVQNHVLLQLILYRNLNVAEDDYLGNDTDEDAAHIISGLHCKIVVQFENYRDFYSTLKVLCCRSLQKVENFCRIILF